MASIFRQIVSHTSIVELAVVRACSRLDRHREKSTICHQRIEVRPRFFRRIVHRTSVVGSDAIRVCSWLEGRRATRIILPTNRRKCILAWIMHPSQSGVFARHFLSLWILLSINIVIFLICRATTKLNKCHLIASIIDLTVCLLHVHNLVLVWFNTFVIA